MGVQGPPRGAEMPRSFSASAIALSDRIPLVRSSSIVGAKSRARLLARAVRASPLRIEPKWRAFSVRFAGFPSRAPRRRAAASATFVRSEIIRASSSATTAMMPTVILFIEGRSPAMISTVASRRQRRNAAFLAKRSSLATTSTARCSQHADRAR
jgi:hypothetical protein